MTRTIELACACGQARIAIDDLPIVVAECHCASCRTFGARLQHAGNGSSVLEANGGTLFNLYRKDRVRIASGSDLLGEVRLEPGGKTRRVVATCCNTPIYLESAHAHWLNLFGNLWPQDARYPIELRTMTSDLVDPSALPADVPNKKRQSVKFFVKLFAAWIAMGFKVPELPPVHRAAHV